MEPEERALTLEMTAFGPTEQESERSRRAVERFLEQRGSILREWVLLVRHGKLKGVALASAASVLLAALPLAPAVPLLAAGDGFSSEEPPAQHAELTSGSITAAVAM